MQYVGKEVGMMRRSTEIYPFQRMVSREIEKIRSDPFNSKVLLKYNDARIAEGISPGRIFKCLNSLRTMSVMLGKPFEQANKDEIVKLVSEIEKRDLAGWTKRDYKVILKHFYKWLRDWEDGMPPEVRWIKNLHSVENKRPILPKDLLTSEEKNSLLRATQNLRDRALLEVLFESGRRLGEILTLHIGDIEFDSLGAKLFVHGKVGEDFARIISSASALAIWLDLHPFRENQNSPVWLGLGGINKMKQMSYAAASSVLKSLARRTGLKKRIHYYLLRHTRIDETQGILTEPQQCMMFGWKFGSRMPGVYMKRYGKHIDNAQSVMNGVSPQVKTLTVQQTKICPRCKFENSPISRFCNKCGTILDIQFATELDERKMKVERLLYDIASDSEKLEKLRDFLSETRRRKA